MTSDYSPMRFKVELLLNGREFTHIFYAIHLQELSEKIDTEFPKATILGIIGGG